MTTYARSLVSVSRWQSRPRLKQSQNTLCNFPLSTEDDGVRESGAFPSEYSLRLKSTELW